MNAYDLAHIITYKINSAGDEISHKKLQKLLYYVEAWYLVYFEGQPLIDEDFQAWIHGPVLPSIYAKLKEHGFNNIQVINDEHDKTIEEEIDAIIKKNSLTSDQLELIDSVLNNYGSLTSMQLELLTHSENPWIEARNGLLPHQPCRNIIRKTTMKTYYSSLL